MFSSKLKNIFKMTIFGMLIAMVILTIMFAIFALVILYSNLSPSLINQMSVVLGSISLFLAAFITSRIVNKNGLLIGFIFGIITSLIIFLITFFLNEVAFSVGELTKIIAITISSCLGGIFGVNSK